MPLHPALDLDAFRHSAFRALSRLVDLCLSEHANFLLLAGDLIEGSVRNYQVGLRLIRELQRLEQSGTQVAWVRGNHDAENRVLPNLLLPGHVTELGLSGVQTLRFEDSGVALVGQSYAERACFEDLLASYPVKDPALCTIGLLHTSGDGAITGDSYAPCRRSELVRKGYDYLALGHVHEPHVLSKNVAYAGCLQGRNFFESGARGCMLVEVARGREAIIGHRSLEVVRFGTITVELTEVSTLDDVVERVTVAARSARLRHPDCSLVIRFRLYGDAGVGLLLATCPTLRQSALYSVVTNLDGRMAIDGFWVDLCHPAVAPILVASNGGDRRDVD